MKKRSHPKTLRTQATTKKVKSVPKRKSDNSNTHCIETRNVFRHCKKHIAEIRANRAKLFEKTLVVEKLIFVVTFDEIWVYLRDSDDEKGLNLLDVADVMECIQTDSRLYDNPSLISTEQPEKGERLMKMHKNPPLISTEQAPEKRGEIDENAQTDLK
ncbi:hypothetical protein TNCV_2245831 [Trichonephila clavipes]|uniref:Uncharacterized protein n=1 Tax=Trichonephila clavipes TaxID=2585209 RepID=A0A8X6R7E5_TRICX|nr:hypothetical protein TNCV_2245831 [Trichonephila clavipes]